MLYSCVFVYTVVLTEKWHALHYVGTIRVIFDRKTKVMCPRDRCTVDANEQQQTNNQTVHDGIMPNEGKDESIQRSTSVLSNQNNLGQPMN